MERGHLIVTPEVAARFKTTVEEVAKMTLGQFCDMAYNSGYDVRITGFNCKDQEHGNLTITMDADERPIVNVDK